MVVFNKHQNTANAIRSLMIEAAPGFLWTTLNHHVYGLALVLPRTMLAHVMNHHGPINDEALAENIKDAQSPWDPNDPTETVFKRITEAATFAQIGGDAMTNAAKMRYALKAFEVSGVMEEANRDWRKKDDADRTWANMPEHYRKANKERLRKNTAGTMGYDTANASRSTTTNNQAPTQPPATRENVHYCWTHGLGSNPEHNSRTCTNPATGHQREATMHNMMGGNNTIRRLRGERAVYQRPRRTNNNNNTEE